MKLALQIYSLRDFLSPERIEDTLHRTRDMGYDGVEWFSRMGYAPAQLAQIAGRAGLSMFSMHRDYGDILACDTEEMEQLAEVGVKYLPIGWLPSERLADGPLFAETCAAICRYAHEAEKRGLYLLYHNHDFDLAPCGDATRLDALFAALPKEVLGAELDTCWLWTGGVDPAAYLRKYADRAPVIHLKDCTAGGGRRGFLPLGRGVLDWDAILGECRRADWLCVEQDEPSPGLDAFACAGISAAFLRGRLA